jgi:hypothetical protein
MRILTAYDSRYRNLGAITVPRLRDWAHGHGHTFEAGELPEGSGSWGKVNYLLDALAADDPQDPEPWWWIDADFVVLPGADDTLPIPSWDGVTCLHDMGGLCLGLFGAGGPWGREFLNLLRVLGRVPGDRHEQDTAKLVIAHFPEVAMRINRLRPGIVADKLGPFDPGASLFHLWAGQAREPVRAASLLARQIWSETTLQEARALLDPLPA